MKYQELKKIFNIKKNNKTFMKMNAKVKEAKEKI